MPNLLTVLRADGRGLRRASDSHASITHYLAQQGRFAMYEDFFGLKDRPYLAAARIDRYYPAASIEQARQAVSRSVERANGFAVVVGPSGTGKSLLCQVLAEQFRRQFKVAHLSTGRLCSPKALMQAVLYELGLPYRDMSEGELRLSLVDHLEPSADCPNGMLLIVDEAHGLPVRLFEEIRMITNLVRDGVPRVRLVLAGNARLEERLNEPRLESFSQRVIARCYLESLSRDDTMQFVRAQYAAAGGDPDQVFDEAALIAVQRATDGIPRLINQLCDHALILARTAGNKRIDNKRIEEAWADLQQLPPPWSEANESEDVAETTIEFGTLDDEPELAEQETHAESVPFITRHDAAEPAHAAFEQTPDPADMNNEIERAARHLDQIDARIAQLNSEQIEEAVASTDEQHFQPLGSFQPEIECDLAATPDMFSESFDEEEVVIDRYSAMSTCLAGRPQVYSTEGRAIADALAPHDVQPPSPRLATVEESVEEHVEETVEDFAEEIVPAFVEPIAEETAEDLAAELTVEITEQPIPPTEIDKQAEDQQPEPQAAEFATSPVDTPLVVIEEEFAAPFELETAEVPQAENLPPAQPPVAVVEPNQFGNLFTNLRRDTGS